MKMLTTLLCFAALPAFVSDAWAQQPTAANSADTRWDVSGQLGLLNRNKRDLSRWDHWYSAAAADGSAGYFWTPHVKTEFNIGAAGHGTIDGEQATPTPGSSFPYQRYREHTLQETTFGATAVYQFFENRWIHPFLGAGVEGARERHRAESLPASSVRFSPTVPALPLQAVPAIDRVSYSARPVVTGGFKFYVSDHAFIRTEVRTSLSTERPLAIQWRGGVGVDLAPAVAQRGDDATAWHTLAQTLDAGATIDVRLRDRRRFKATLIDARADAVVLQRKSRVPVPVETVPYESIASMHRVDASRLSPGNVAGIALGSAGAAVGTLFLVLLATLD